MGLRGAGCCELAVSFCRTSVRCQVDRLGHLPGAHSLRTQGGLGKLCGYLLGSFPAGPHSSDFGTVWIACSRYVEIPRMPRRPYQHSYQAIRSAKAFGQLSSRWFLPLDLYCK